MTDYFAVLQQPRRPWLDPEKLKQEYQQLTLRAHPDRAQTGQPSLDFATVNDAYRTLASPKRRLQHLLALVPGPAPASSSVPNEMTQLFMQTAELIEETDRLLGQAAATGSHLSKALLKPRLSRAKEKIEAALDQLNRLHEQALSQLQELDRSWEEKSELLRDELGELAQRFTYLERWIDQLRERQFQLSV